MDHQSAPALGPKWPNAATIIAEDHFLIRSGSAIMIATAATATARSLFAATKSLNRRCSVKLSSLCPSQGRRYLNPLMPLVSMRAEHSQLAKNCDYTPLTKGAFHVVTSPTPSALIDQF